jgi:hypothetical protein
MGHLLLTMDFAQNIALPHVSETPSQWYFLSLVSVNVFGIYSANSGDQTMHIYSERTGGKGSNEVVSLLKHSLYGAHGEDEYDLYKGAVRLTVYADNCGGQNKNNFVLKFFLLLAHIGAFSEINYKFFVRGHTKNACDRGFGRMKKKLTRHDCWTISQLEETLNSSSTATVSFEDDDKTFYDFKPVATELYKNLPGIQKFQLFRMQAALQASWNAVSPPSV